MFLILIRRPGATLKSIMKILNTMSNLGLEPNAGGVEPALARYVQHLGALSGYARRFERLGRRPLLLESERIVDETDNILRRLESHLQLTSKLSEDYSVFQHTGTTWYKGDNSPYIRTGSVQRERSDYPELDLPQAYLERAEQEYQRCLAVLSATCLPLIGSAGAPGMALERPTG